MIGGRSDQMVLLPCASPGSARLECAEDKRRISYQWPRAPPHEATGIGLQQERPGRLRS